MTSPMAVQVTALERGEQSRIHGIVATALLRIPLIGLKEVDNWIHMVEMFQEGEEKEELLLDLRVRRIMLTVPVGDPRRLEQILEYYTDYESGLDAARQQLEIMRRQGHLAMSDGVENEDPQNDFFERWLPLGNVHPEDAGATIDEISRLTDGFWLKAVHPVVEAIKEAAARGAIPSQLEKLARSTRFDYPLADCLEELEDDQPEAVTRIKIELAELGLRL